MNDDEIKAQINALIRDEIQEGIILKCNENKHSIYARCKIQY